MTHVFLPYSPDILPDLVAVHSSYASHINQHPTFPVSHWESIFLKSEVDPRRDIFISAENKSVTGFSWIYSRENSNRVILRGPYIDPINENVKALLEAHLDAVFSRVKRMPLDFLQMRSFLPDWDAVYEKKGLEYRGSYARMKLFPLKGDLARAEIPGGGKIRKWKNDQDLTLIHKMFVSIFKEHWDFETPSMDDWRSVLKSGNFNDDLVLIAEQNGDSVGYSFGDILGSSIEDKFPSGYLISIGVLKSARRLGWGRAILSRWLTEVYGAKIKSVELDVDTSNESAIRLYESYGFKTIRTEKVWSRSLDRV